MKSTSMTAHVIQRISGVLLLIYLFLHVHTIHELAPDPRRSMRPSPPSAIPSSSCSKSRCWAR